MARLNQRYFNKRGRNSFIDFFQRSIINWIILFNFIAYFIIFLMIQFFGLEKTLSLVALQANGFFQGRVWTLFTSMFAHVELWHLLANMFSLYFIGNFVEKLIGRKRLLVFYLISGIFAYHI